MAAPIFNERTRRALIPLLAMALVAGYLFVLLPLGHRAQNLDEPLDKAWRNLSAALNQTNNPTIDFVGITNQTEAIRLALTAVDAARKRAAEQTELGDIVRERMNIPFQLVDYESERGRLQDELNRLAAQHKVKIDPAVFGGFPSHTAEVRQPALLWAELEMINSLLTTAIRCEVASIGSLNVPMVLTNVPPPVGVRTVAEIPIQIDLVGDAPKVINFLRSLPLRAEELKAAGLPEANTNKPALFIDRMVLRKQSPNKPEEISASLRIVGFVVRD